MMNKKILKGFLRFGLLGFMLPICQAAMPSQVSQQQKQPLTNVNVSLQKKSVRPSVKVPGSINFDYLGLQPYGSAQQNTNLNSNEFYQWVLGRYKLKKLLGPKLKDHATTGQLADALGGVGVLSFLARLKEQGEFLAQDIRMRGEEDAKNAATNRDILGRQIDLGLQNIELGKQRITEAQLKFNQVKYVEDSKFKIGHQVNSRQRNLLKFLGGPAPLVFVASIAGCAIAYQVACTMVTWIFKDRKPKTIKYSSVRGFVARLYNKTVAQKSGNKLLFNSHTTKELNDVWDEIKNWAKGGKIAPNILLYGPPGSGKSSLPYKWAKAANLPMVHTGAKRITQLNETGLMEREMINLWAHAEKEERVLFFIDEADLLGDEVIKTLLELLDSGLATNVLLILATNHIQKVPKAVLSRVAEKIKIGLPDEETSSRIFDTYAKKECSKYGLIFDYADLKTTKAKLKKESARTIENEVKRAVNRASRKGASKLQTKHFRANKTAV